MKVKCPKCRYRFDLADAPGMQELQCNCPRCGMPFTFAVDDESIDNQMNAETLESTDLADTNDSATKKQDHAEVYSNSSTQTDDCKASSVPPPIYPNFNNIQKTSNPLNAHPFNTDIHGENMIFAKYKSKGYVKKMLVLAVVFVVAMTFIARQCSTSTSYTADDVGLSDTSENYTDDQSDAGSAPSFNSNAAPEKAPGWIQGNWHIETDYGGISLKIHGDQIAETSGGETAYGTYKYQAHRLYCDFGDNNEFVYKLVEESRQIDAGNGMLMRKAD